MKSFVVFALCIAAVVAAPPAYSGDEKQAEIISLENNNIGLNEYNAKSETSNGIFRQEEGHLINPGTENEAFVVRGSYSYTGADGIVYTVTYTADENGFHPEGAHLPKAA